MVRVTLLLAVKWVAGTLNQEMWEKFLGHEARLFLSFVSDSECEGGWTAGLCLWRRL